MPSGAKIEGQKPFISKKWSVLVDSIFDVGLCKMTETCGNDHSDGLTGETIPTATVPTKYNERIEPFDLRKIK